MSGVEQSPCVGGSRAAREARAWRRAPRAASRPAREARYSRARVGLGSVLLGVFAFVCMFGGMLLTVVPFVGTMLSFLGPVLSLAGIVLGGVAMSRAKQYGENDGLAVAGLVVNIVAFLPAMLVAIACGGCNICCTGMLLTPSDPNATPFWMQDSGPSPFDDLFRDAGSPWTRVPSPPPPAFPPPPIDPGATQPPGAPADPGAAPDPAAPPAIAPPATADPGAGALPPPPLPPGPSHPPRRTRRAPREPASPPP
jgi:hypothetical protein